MSTQNVYMAAKRGLTEVAALDHEILDDAVELGTLVSHPSLERRAILLHTGRQRTEVLDGLWHSLSRKRQSDDALHATHSTRHVRRRRDP